jgi:hypothetical protein
MRLRLLLVVSLLALVAFVPPAAEGQEGFDDPELPPGTVTVAGEFTSGKFLDPGTMATSPDQTLVYWDYQLVDHDLVFWVFPSIDGQPTSVLGYGEVAQRYEFEMDHFLNDEPGTTRRAYTAITEMDFDGTWDGTDPGRVEGTVTWTVPEARVDVEWNEHSWGPVPSPTNGIYTGPGWTAGTFTATWSPSTGEMQGVIDTGPWNGGFEALVIQVEPAKNSPSAGASSRLSIPCFFDAAPGSTPACEGGDLGIGSGLQGSGLGLLAALSSFGTPLEVQESVWSRLQLPADAQERRVKLEEAGVEEGDPFPGFAYRGPSIEEPTLRIYHPTLAFLWLGYLVPEDGGDPPFPIFRTARPLFVALYQAEMNAQSPEERLRVERATDRLARLFILWEATGSMPRPLDTAS